MNRREFSSLLTLSTLGFGMTSLKELSNWGATLTNTPPVPVLFIGHGSPMNAIEENQFVAGFRKVAKTLPEIQAILVISAHWLTRGTAVTAMQNPRTIHDFGGFPQALFEQQYPAPGSPDLAKTIQSLFTEGTVHEDHEWGLDHGTWTVLKHLYPSAQIPVVQLSINYQLPLKQHFELATLLQKLRQRGVLIIGSGNIVHNLRAVDFSKINTVGYGYDWAHESRAFVNEKIQARQFNALFNLETAPKALQLAVPSTDHFIPLLYTLGLCGASEEIQIFNDELLAGSLSMTSLRIG